MAGRAGPHGDPGRQRGGARRRGGCGAQGQRWKGWRASRDHGEAMGGAVVDQEGLGWSAHGGQGVSPEKNTGGDGGSGVRGEMRGQKRAKWREGKLLKVLDQKRRVGEARMVLAMTAARWRPGRAWAEAGRRGARGRRPEERG
jgi:hypothetical protein